MTSEYESRLQHPSMGLTQAALQLLTLLREANDPEVGAALTTFSHAIQSRALEDAMKNLFGNDREVIVRVDGTFEVLNYDHD